jgi:ubiquinone/menaquinone biosynthesis C-methylase UbiE
MKNINEYLNMQKNQYEFEASNWSLQNLDHVVGSYQEHNNWKDYDDYLFKDINTNNLVGLEYGCGPARNLIRFNNRFLKIDGCDISKNNIDKAELNLKHNNINNYSLFICDGKSIPAQSEFYDIIFSVICLQHIACYDIRYSIFNDIYRCLKKDGYFCFQMGFGKKNNFNVSNYYDNSFDVNVTNGLHDVIIEDENYLINDLKDKIGFRNYISYIRPTGPGDYHENWIWVQAQK